MYTRELSTLVTIPYSANSRSAEGLEAPKRKAELELYAHRRLELTQGFKMPTKRACFKINYADKLTIDDSMTSSMETVG